MIDTSCGTAISASRTKPEADTDASVTTAFYERWPSGNPTDGFSSPEGVTVYRAHPLMTPGFWLDHDFGDD